MDRYEEVRCCICNELILGYGNNAMPYRNGLCCDRCNRIYVIPYRIKQTDMKEVKSDAQ